MNRQGNIIGAGGPNGAGGPRHQWCKQVGRDEILKKGRLVKKKGVVYSSYQDHGCIGNLYIISYVIYLKYTFYYSLVSSISYTYRLLHMYIERTCMHIANCVFGIV